MRKRRCVVCHGMLDWGEEEICAVCETSVYYVKRCRICDKIIQEGQGNLCAHCRSRRRARKHGEYQDSRR